VDTEFHRVLLSPDIPKFRPALHSLFARSDQDAPSRLPTQHGLLVNDVKTSFLHTFGESNVAELRRHFQKSLLERMDVFNAPC